MLNDLKYLDKIESPAQLRKLPLDTLPKVASEIRKVMLAMVSQSGGHLAPSLGAVDLAVALHYCYNTPDDKIIWDVGHQAYAHKILTGRLGEFETLRRYGGISGFPRLPESPFDSFSVGHASTSISAGLGMAVARDLKKEKHSVIAVIGDGSMSGGLAFEGLNNLGSLGTDMTIVLNDNRMSISKNVGAMSRYLTRMITDKRFNKIRNDIWELTGRLSHVGKGIRTLVHNIDEVLKHALISGKLFEDMGVRYFGPVDGHNIAEMVEVFKFVRDMARGPVMIHVLTTKGKGYSFAENDATKFHGIGGFSLDTGDVQDTGPAPTYSEVFGRGLVELAGNAPEVVAVTAAMPDGTGLNFFRDAFPGRFFDVGIAESHAVTFAAGLAVKGIVPVVAVYSTFLQRAYDQIVHDVALDNLHVVFCLDRAGIVGEDGPTHHGTFDLSYLRSIPNVVVMAPSDEKELRNMLYTAVHRLKGPVCIRFPRGRGPGVKTDSGFEPIEILRPRLLRKGTSCAIVSAGDTGIAIGRICEILEKEHVRPSVVDARFVKPLDAPFYKKLFAEHRHIITVEGNALCGGFGSAVLELCNTIGPEEPPRILRLGYPDEFIPHGATRKLLETLGLDPESAAEKIASFLKE
jgi:1-deoxy-D-xylulose-5-phosphate synthase